MVEPKFIHELVTKTDVVMHQAIQLTSACMCRKKVHLFYYIGIFDIAYLLLPMLDNL